MFKLIFVGILLYATALTLATEHEAFYTYEYIYQREMKPDEVSDLNAEAQNIVENYALQAGGLDSDSIQSRVKNLQNDGIDSNAARTLLKMKLFTIIADEKKKEEEREAVSPEAQDQAAVRNKQ